MAVAERAKELGKVLECESNISSFKTQLLSYSTFVRQMEKLAGDNKELSSLLDKIDLISHSALKNLDIVEKHLSMATTDEDLPQEMLDYIAFFGIGLVDDGKKSAIKKSLSVDLAIEIEGESFDLNLSTIEGLQKQITSKNAQYLKIAKAAQEIAPSVAAVNQALNKLGKIDDPAGRDTIAGQINAYRDNYNWKTTEAKKVLAELDAIYPALYDNFTTVNNLLTEIVNGKTSLSDPECEGLVDAINYLIGATNEYDGENRQPEIITKVDVSFKKNAFAKTEKLSDDVNMNTLEAKLGKAEEIFSQLPSHHKKGSTANKVVKVVAGVSAGLIAAVLIAGGVYHGVKAAKESGAIIYQDELNSQQEEQQKNIASIRKDISDYITQVNGKIDSVVSNSENWSARVGGDKALEDLKSYQDGTNENLVNLNDYNEEVLATNESSAAQQLYAQATTAYNAIMNDLTDIEESVGGFKDVNVSNAIIKGISQDSLKGWQQAFTKSQVLAINISDIRTQEDGDSALVQIVFQKDNGERYISEGEVAGVSAYYQDGSLSADDISAMLQNKQGNVQSYKDYSTSFGFGDTVFIYGIENVLSGREGASVEYQVYSSTGQLVTRGEILYNNISQNATKDMILQAVEDAIYGQNEM